MMQNSKLNPSPIKKLFTERHSNTEDKDYYEDEQHIQEDQNHRGFMKRFKTNQQTLRNKFKNYVDKKKCIFPHTYQRFRSTNFAGAEEQNIREVRRQKQELIEEMNRSQNETSYYLNRNRQHEKFYDILANKWKRVENIRKQRKSEVVRLEKSLKALKQQIKQEKMVLVRKISNSKINLTKSRQQLNQRKLSLAKDVRVQKLLHRSIISTEKNDSYIEKKMKCKSVRDSEQKVTIYVDRVRQQKKQIAQDLRLSKLFREIAQRQQVKVDALKIKRRSKRQIEHFQSKTLSLQEKIKEFRKSLGERRINPLFKMKSTKYQKYHSFTQSNEFTTNSQDQYMNNSSSSVGIQLD